MIFTNGDSFTYGDELDKPYSEAWPYILSQMLNLDVVNFGENGKDNAGIVQTTKDYWSITGSFSEAFPPTIWIIQWSTFRRFNDNPPIDVILQKLDKQYLLDLYFVHVRDLQDWFEEHNFSYIMFNGFDNEKYISDSDSEFKQLVDDKYFIGWPDEAVVNWVYEYEHGPRGHPRAEGHRRIAEILYENIRSKLRFP
jgi:hypothetical protein